MSNGKGDKRRPMKVSSKEYSSNWDLIFKDKSANLSFSEQVLDKDSKFETRVGVLFHPEDPKLSNKVLNWDDDFETSVGALYPGSRQEKKKEIKKPKEIGGRKDGLEPTRYNDWEKSGRCIDF
tara:strand:+ start:96 stop:464 length:369 start_codon:yes stop_codon:yes gene_type:complete